ncbi:ABC-three component system protein [Companilactobacillus zhachilii]|uniref:ABC-three component system protein n=1 Tax=Companilactobacillus zhachilii TaxID=2304606 RepID=UPI003075E123
MFKNHRRIARFLVSKVKMSGRMNLLDDHVLAESFFLRFLNELYGWNLCTSNVNVSNAAAVDLIDVDRKISVQVTTNIRKDKIQSTLTKAKEALKDYQIKFLFITTDARKLSKMSYSNPENVLFDPKKDIIDTSRLMMDCQSCDVATLLILQKLCKDEIIPVQELPVQNSEIVEVLRAVSKIHINVLNDLKIPRPFSIQEKIDYNKLKPIQNQTIDELVSYNPNLDTIYETFAQDGVSPGIIFQKLSSIYQNQTLRSPDQSAPITFLNMVTELMKYVIDSFSLDSEMSPEKIEYCCRIILVDAFVRCKIFIDPEGYHYDTTNRHSA